MKDEHLKVNKSTVKRKKNKNSSKWRGIELTDEQINAINLSLTGENLKIEAYAGTGKTLTLLAISDYLNYKKGIYLAFNKSTSQDAQKRFPENVDCRTAHSIAYEHIGYKYRQKIGPMPSTKLEELIDLQEIPEEPEKTAEIILLAINKFCFSADQKIFKKHIKDIKKDINITGNTGVLFSKHIDNLLLKTKKVWQDMKNPKGHIPISHDGYLKLWQLQNPKIPADYILFDEAHDANPCMLSIVENQSLQKIYVGDRYQQIYAWRGAINAMEQINTKEYCSLTKSFRFGNKIADLAYRIIKEKREVEIPIRGNEDIPSSISNKNSYAHIFRTKFGLINFCIKCINNNVNVYIIGGINDTLQLLKQTKSLISGKRITKGELSFFKSWKDLVRHSETNTGSYYRTYVNLIIKYGINYLIYIFSNKIEENILMCDVVASTAHKSKGTEWDYVEIGDDFYSLNETLIDKNTPHEANLLYVACTRAKQNINITQCKFLKSLYSKNEQKKITKKLDSDFFENMQNNKKNYYCKLLDINNKMFFSESYIKTDIYYAKKLLGLQGEFSAEDIKKSYLEKLKSCHPESVEDLDIDIQKKAIDKATVLRNATLTLLNKIS